MKTLILSLLLAALGATVQAGPSHLSGPLYVGDSTAATQVYLSGVAEVSKEIDLRSIMQGANGLTLIDSTAITTAMYIANPTNLSLSAAALFYPAEVDTAIARIRVRVPKNYRSGGVLVLDCHMGVTYAADLSITASAVQYPVGGLTNTTLVTLAPVYLYGSVSPTSSVNAPTPIRFNVPVTVVPESVITYHIKKAGALILQITGARWVYRSGGVLDGQ